MSDFQNAAIWISVEGSNVQIRAVADPDTFAEKLTHVGVEMLMGALKEVGAELRNAQSSDGDEAAAGLVERVTMGETE